MNKTNQIAVKLNQEILNSSECRHYMHDLEALRKHPELFELEKELKNLQQAILKERTKKDGDSYVLEMEYKQKMQAFQNHPLIVNYLEDKESLNGLTDYVQTYIQGLLD